MQDSYQGNSLAFMQSIDQSVQLHLNLPDRYTPYRKTSKEKYSTIGQVDSKKHQRYSLSLGRPSKMWNRRYSSLLCIRSGYDVALE